MSGQFNYRLYLVISEAACLGRDPVKVAAQAVRGGADLVQLREKHTHYTAFKMLSLKLKEMLDGCGVPLLINDNLQLAMECGTSGVHVGRSDIPPTVIRRQWPGVPVLGYSLESLSQLAGPESSAASYLGVSPVFRTPTKTDTIGEWGLNGLEQLRRLTTKPLVAIGGIQENNAAAVIKAGADCLAVVSAICSAADPERAAAIIRNQIEKA